MGIHRVVFFVWRSRSVRWYTIRTPYLPAAKAFQHSMYVDVDFYSRHLLAREPPLPEGRS